MNVAIIGCGLIGQKRARALGENRLVMTADVSPDRAKSVANLGENAIISTDWQSVIKRDDIDIVIVATTNDHLAQITLAAVESGKHVLVEKPAARFSYELDPIVEVARRAKVYVKVGFNIRYHPALRKAREIVDSGALGPLMFVRGRYGHGGRIGYDKEWRAKPERAGGGELLDQGIHLIDLSRWFLGEFEQVEGFTHTYFWDMSVEDNGFVMLKTASQQVAWLHASCTEWKNLFSFEIYGRDGKLHIEGLGGSYGVERLTYYRMLPQMGPPETTIWEFPLSDNSWQLEFMDFVRTIKEKIEPQGNLNDAKAALNIIHKIYGGMNK